MPALTPCRSLRREDPRTSLTRRNFLNRSTIAALTVVLAGGRAVPALAADEADGETLLALSRLLYTAHSLPYPGDDAIASRVVVARTTAGEFEGASVYPLRKLRRVAPSGRFASATEAGRRAAVASVAGDWLPQDGGRIAPAEQLRQIFVVVAGPDVPDSYRTAALPFVR